MEKSDLISGKHIVELRDGSRLLVAGDFLPDIDGNGFMCLKSYSDGLKFNDCEVDYDKCHTDFDMLKVYEIVRHKSLPILAHSMYTACKVIWERKPELSEVERVILENLYRDSNYITRDESGELWLFENRPIKKDYSWDLLNGFGENFNLYKHLFKMVKWEDDEPTLISDLLEVNNNEQ